MIWHWLRVWCGAKKNHYKLCKCHWNGCCRKEQKFFHHASSPKKVSKKSENMACKKSFGSFWTSESHNLSHLFPFSLYYSSSHLQIMKAIMLLLRQTPFYDYEFLVRLGTKYSLHLCMQKRPHKIWANAFNKLSQDNAWKVPQTKILCTAKSGSAATKYAKKSGEIGVLLDIMSLSAVFFDVFTNKSNFLRFQFQSCYF